MEGYAPPRQKWSRNGPELAVYKATWLNATWLYRAISDPARPSEHDHNPRVGGSSPSSGTTATCTARLRRLGVAAGRLFCFAPRSARPFLGDSESRRRVTGSCAAGGGLGSAIGSRAPIASHCRSSDPQQSSTTAVPTFAPRQELLSLELDVRVPTGCRRPATCRPPVPSQTFPHCRSPCGGIRTACEPAAGPSPARSR